MTYQHKKDRMKDTREIVENILQSKASDYDLTKPSDIVTSGKTIQIIRGGTGGTNVLPDDTEEILDQCDDESVMVDGKCVRLEDLESYEPIQEIEMDIEVTELKEGIEKKKKKRNYIEFKKDYEKE